MASFSKKLGLSNKHIQIDKANTLTLVAASVTTAIVIFSLVAAQALVKQMSYQNKVIGLRSKASKQLTTNVKSAATLNTAYQTFDNAPESIIGTKDKNSVIVLDSLPSKYDFPALVTSLEGIINGSGSKIVGINGTDDQANAAQTSATPKPIAMPFQVSAGGSFATAQKLIADLERSIRPMQITSLDLIGGDSNLQITIDGNTYYQPEKKLSITQTVITNGSTTAKKTTATTQGAKK